MGSRGSGRRGSGSAGAGDARGQDHSTAVPERGLPQQLLSSVLAQLDDGPKPGTVLLAGAVGSGKTQFAEVLAHDLRGRGVEVGGVLAPRILQDGETVGYRIRDLSTGEERPFAHLDPPGIPLGRFYVCDEGLKFALAAIERGARQAQVVFLDEVGRWELSGGGLAPAVRSVLASPVVSVLLVRDALVDRVLSAFALGRAEIVRLPGQEATE